MVETPDAFGAMKLLGNEVKLIILKQDVLIEHVIVFHQE